MPASPIPEPPPQSALSSRLPILNTLRDSFNSGSKSGLYLLLAIGVSGALLFLAFRGVDFAALAATLRSTRLEFLLAAGAMVTAGGIVRSLRWRALLSAEKPIAAGTVFWAMMVGYMGNNLLPFRAGEVFRSVLIGRAGNISKSYALATALMERALDTMLLLLAVPLLLPYVAGLSPSFTRKTHWITAIGVAAILTLPFLLRFTDRAVKKIANLPIGSPDLRMKLAGLAAEFSLGLTAFFDTGRGIRVCLFSLAAWSLDTCAAILVSYSIGQNLDFVRGFTLLVFLGLSSALPSTPGYLGIYQFVAVSVLCPFGFLRSQALAYILLFQAVIYVVTLSCGIAGLWILGRMVRPVAQSSS